jgi:hypothetical protein
MMDGQIVPGEWWYCTAMVGLQQRLRNHIQSRNLAHSHSHTLSLHVGSTGGRHLLESFGVCHHI